MTINGLIPGLLATFLVTGFCSKSQTPGNEFSKISSLPLQAPQVSSISKYVEFPVSYYSGLAQIALPIYEVKNGDISVPISLSYHGGGIKVQEEASWVGLGWSLIAGGVISHEIKGEDDEYLANHMLHSVYPNEFQNSYQAFSKVELRASCVSSNAADVFKVDGTRYTCNDLYVATNTGQNVDGEPDIYSYSFGQYSGKFFAGIGAYIDLGKNNIQFTGSGGSSFTAITPDGYIYEFNLIEKAWSYPTPHATNTAYYLTKIKSPSGKSVAFQYKSFKTLYDERSSWSSQYSNISTAWGNDGTTLQLPALSEYYVNSQLLGYTNGIPPCSESTGLRQTYSTTTSSNYYLDRILFDNGYVTFEKGTRSDMYGVKLESVNVYRTNGSLVKMIPFSYGYFTSDTNDDDMFDLANKVKYLTTNNSVPNYYPTSFRNQRLKLISVQIDPCPNLFNYYEGTDYKVPFKTSFNQDFWGYYNGGHNNPSLVPDYNLYSQQMSLSSYLSSWHGANRNADDAYIRGGTLKSIVHPTGGVSEFTYEMNQFDNLSSQQQITYTPVTVGGMDVGVGIKKFYFTIGASTVADITGGLYCNGMQDINSPNYNCGCYSCGSGAPENNLYAYIEKVDPTSHAVIYHDLTWQFDINNDNVRSLGGSISLLSQNFEPGTYCITVNYPDNHIPSGDVTSNRRAELYVNYYTPITIQGQAIGGGLRVSNIKDYDQHGQSLERNFSYSGGKMMRYPLYYSTATMSGSHIESFPDFDIIYTGNYRLHYLYSTPSSPFSQSANGSAIGYDQVTEQAIGSTSIGKTVYDYRNAPDLTNTTLDAYLPGIPSTGFLDNGFLKKVCVYDNNNAMVKQTVNDLQIGVANTYWAFKYRAAADNGDSWYNFFNYGRYTFYPITVGRPLTYRSKETTYSTAGSLTVDKIYSYNNKGLVAQVSSPGSDGSTISTHYSYALDYTGVNSGWIQQLKDKNYIGIPLEILAKKNGLVTGGSFTTYAVANNTIVPSQVHKIETAAPANIASTAPTGIIPPQLKIAGTLEYDLNYNLKQAQADKNIYTSYIWGYGNRLPVAKIINAQQKDLFYASFENGEGNSLDGDSRTGKQSWIGSYSQSLNNLSPGDFILSYWLRSNSIWVLQEQIISSAQIVNGAYTINLNGQIDELRFYPKGAQMVTYTYDPLVGMTSQTDVNNSMIFYEYDSYMRLFLIRDKDKNILKKFSYNCTGASGNGIVIDPNPQWQASGSNRCLVDANGQYTGYQEREERDLNPNSVSYNLTRWVSNGYNPSVCSACNSSNCTGNNHKCFNGICQTGIYQILSRHHDPMGNQCITNYGYVFSDGSVQYDHTEVTPGVCNP